jgi:hypothetical protein
MTRRAATGGKMQIPRPSFVVQEDGGPHLSPVSQRALSHVQAQHHPVPLDAPGRAAHPTPNPAPHPDPIVNSTFNHTGNHHSFRAAPQSVLPSYQTHQERIMQRRLDWRQQEDVKIKFWGAPLHVTTQAVWNTFNGYGPIAFIELLTDQTSGARNGEGFVRFK